MSELHKVLPKSNITMDKTDKHTFDWKKPCNCCRATIPTFLICWPLFPITIFFWLSRSTMTKPDIRITGSFLEDFDGFDSLNSVIWTSQQYGISALSEVNKAARTISEAMKRSVRSVKRSSSYNGGDRGKRASWKRLGGVLGLQNPSTSAGGGWRRARWRRRRGHS